MITTCLVAHHRKLKKTDWFFLEFSCSSVLLALLFLFFLTRH
jgi:hypothetical protein